MKALAIGYTSDFIEIAQREPFIYNQKALREVDIEIEFLQVKTLQQMGEACQKYDSDAVFFLPYWNENQNEVESVFKMIRQQDRSRKLIFIDPFAQTSSNYFNILPHVDWFLKRQCLKDPNKYKQQFVGGTMFTDFIAKQWGWDLDGWNVSSQIQSDYSPKLTTGWNLGTAHRFLKALFPPAFWFHSARDIDIFCRLSLGSMQQQEWYSFYRRAAVQALQPLRSDYNVVAKAGFIETGLVARRQYLKELKRSQIVFSPFGWGETCWRDFEAVCCGCLLVKPSMAHIVTKPNIFIEGETYVSVRWDLADLEEKCRYYLENPDEAARIVENARQVYRAYFKKQTFVQQIRQILTSPAPTLIRPSQKLVQLRG